MTTRNDDFDRADGLLGSNWTAPSAGSFDWLEIVSNAAQAVPSNQFGEAYWSADVFGVNQRSRVVLNGLNNPDVVHVRVWVNFDTDRNGYAATAYQASGACHLWIDRMVEGAATNLDYVADPVFADGDVLELVRTATGLSFLHNDVEVCSYTFEEEEETFDGGSVGFGIYSDPGPCRALEWEGGDVSSGGAQTADLPAAAGMGVAFTAQVNSYGELVAAIDVGHSLGAQAAAIASITAGLGAGSSDDGSAAGLSVVSVPVVVAAVAEAIAQAAAALAAGVAAGETWASKADAAATLAAGGLFGAQFDADSDGAETGALTAGTAAAAQFIAAAQTIASLSPGATVAMVLAGIAQSLGALPAGVSVVAAITSAAQAVGTVLAPTVLTIAASALVVAQAATSQGVLAGEWWAGHASTAAALAAGGQFGAVFASESASAQTGALTAGTDASIQFTAAAQALGALTGATSLAVALIAITAAFASLTAGVQLGATFSAAGSNDAALPPAKATLEVTPRVRALRIIPRVRSTRLH